ncbi:MAG: Gfo/Idh/MocA family oxidoreductase [Candidatus Borkfalkiaceae bacterium]|nr:Gfo/Idh/MocA family oxidoreductase [Christensenellaceae bacterium]
MNIGIAGLGAIAPLHIRAILDCGQKIIAICDVDAARCKKINDEFNLGAKEYSDYNQMIDSGEVDVIHVCLPHYLHSEVICKALSKDIHVLCEKPLAINFEQLNDIEKAVNNSSATLGVCFQNRYNASVLYLKEFFKGKEITAATANLVWQRDEKYYASGAWRGKKQYEGGGVMINQAIHSLDLLQWFCGMPETVIAHCSNNSLQGVIDVEDTAYGLFSLKNGGNFVINATNAAKNCFTIISMFHAGDDTVELSGDNLIVNGKFVTKSDGTPIFGKEEWGVGHNNLIREFYNCLEKGEKFPIDFYEGSKTVKLILKMYESNGKKINI